MESTYKCIHYGRPSTRVRHRSEQVLSSTGVRGSTRVGAHSDTHSGLDRHFLWFRGGGVEFEGHYKNKKKVRYVQSLTCLKYSTLTWNTGFEKKLNLLVSSAYLINPRLFLKILKLNQATEYNGVREPDIFMITKYLRVSIFHEGGEGQIHLASTPLDTR